MAVPLSPSSIVRGRFLSEPVRTSSPPAIRRIPRPPAAASAAGGRGIHGSRCVHSLGVRGGVLAGSAGVVAVVPEWLLVAVVFSSDGAAPVELRRGSAAPSSFAARRSSREDFPFAGFREMADLVIDDLKEAVAEGQGGVAVRRAGWRCFGTEERSTSWSRWGASQSKVSEVMRRVSPAWRLARRRRCQSSKGLRCNFFVLWAFLYESCLM